MLQDRCDWPYLSLGQGQIGISARDTKHCNALMSRNKSISNHNKCKKWFEYWNKVLDNENKQSMFKHVNLRIFHTQTRVWNLWTIVEVNVKKVRIISVLELLPWPSILLYRYHSFHEIMLILNMSVTCEVCQNHISPFCIFGSDRS